MDRVFQKLYLCCYNQVRFIRGKKRLRRWVDEKSNRKEKGQLDKNYADVRVIIAVHRDGENVHYFEEFPINMLHEFTNSTGFPVKQVLVLVMEYGSEFSGPGKDIFRYDRATGDPGDAHNSNFLHPVLYYYDTVPTSESTIVVIVLCF